MIARVPLSAFLSTPLVLRLDAGPSQRLGGRLFRKDVARVGEWKHPGTGQLVSFSRDDLVGIADRTNAYSQAIKDGIRFPNKHDGQWIDGKQPNAEDNLGRWLSFGVDGDTLFGVVEAADNKIADMLGGRIRGVSLCLVPEAKDSHGNVFKGVLDHVAATPEPVIDGQDNFVALSRNGTPGTPVPVLRPSTSSTEDRPMALSPHMKKVAQALGMGSSDMDETADEGRVAELVVSKIKTICDGASSMSKSVGEVQALSAQVATLRGDLEAEKAKTLALSKEREDRETAECERQVGDLVALAAKHGKPETFNADRQKFVRERWSKDRESAMQTLAMSRELAGAIAQPEAGAAVVQPADKAKAADDAKTKLEAKIAMAKHSGGSYEVVGNKVHVTRTDGVKITI